METSITTMQELATLINSSDEWKLEFARIIETNGWHDDTGTEFGICHNDEEKLLFNEAGEATVVDIETETKRIGARVAAIRKAKGLSQDKLAELSQVPPTQVQNIEQGKHSPSVRTLSKVLAALGCKIGIIPID